MIGVTSDNVARLWAIGVPEVEVDAMRTLLEQGLAMIDPAPPGDHRLRVV